MVNVEYTRIRDDKVLWWTDNDMTSRKSAEEYLRHEGYSKKGGLWVRRLEEGALIAVIRRVYAD